MVAVAVEARVEGMEGGMEGEEMVAVKARVNTQKAHHYNNRWRKGHTSRPHLSS